MTRFEDVIDAFSHTFSEYLQEIASVLPTSYGWSVATYVKQGREVPGIVRAAIYVVNADYGDATLAVLLDGEDDLPDPAVFFWEFLVTLNETSSNIAGVPRGLMSAATDRLLGPGRVADAGSVDYVIKYGVDPGEGVDGMFATFEDRGIVFGEA